MLLWVGQLVSCTRMHMQTPESMGHVVHQSSYYQSFPFPLVRMQRKCCNVPKKRQERRLQASKRRHTIRWLLKMLHFDIQVALERVPLLQPHLSMRFISWSPSPLRKRSRLAGSIKQEQRASKRFSIISCSSAVDGLWRLNTWEGRRRREHLERTPRKACCSYMRRKEWGRQIIITWQKILARVAEQLRERRGDRVENTQFWSTTKFEA